MTSVTVLGSVIVATSVPLRDDVVSVAPGPLVSPPWTVLVAPNVTTGELLSWFAEASTSCGSDPLFFESRCVWSSVTTGGVITGLSTDTVESVEVSSLASSDVVVPVFCAPLEELCVPPLTEESPGRVVDGSDPTVETGPEPVVVDPEGLPDEPDSVPVVVDPDVVVVDPDDEDDESVDEFVDPEDEPDDSDELDDESESFGAANAAPIPPVPTNPTTPSEKARDPIRSACFCEFTYSPSAALDL
jgi:hypothetical protein